MDIRYSQNFLRRPGLVESLLSKTDINQQDLVLEIGPGRGIITGLLAQRAKQVIAVELDKRLASQLKENLADQSNVKIIRADFLGWPLPSEPYKVFANIPFALTAQIVIRLLAGDRPPQMAYLIMQDKAAERFIGLPVASENTQMSILLQPWYEMGVIAHIDQKEFRPIPRVEAVLAYFRKRKEPLVENGEKESFRDFVIYGFNQWERTILDAFKKVFSSKQRGALDRDLNIANSKPTDLSLKQWLEMFEIFIAFVAEDKKKLVCGAEQRLREQQRDLKKRYRTR